MNRLPSRRSWRSTALLAPLLAPAFSSLVAACSASDASSLTSASSTAGSTSSGGPGGSGDSGGIFQPGPTDHDDFKSPILDTDVPADAPGLFGQPDKDSSGPCLFEPELGSLFPNNWLRPRFRFNASPEQNLFEIKLSIPNEKSPLVVYTKSQTWTMDQATWQILTSVGVGGPIHVTVRAATYADGALTSGPTLGSEGDIEIAPVSAPGSVVYWTTSGGTVLKGFKIGDETVKDVMKPAQVSTGCVACHSSTPDGNYVGFSARDNLSAGGDTDRTDLRSLDGKLLPPAFLTPAAQALLARPGQEGVLYSKAHWKDGDRVQVMQYLVNSKWELAWTDLEAQSQAQDVGWGIFTRSGDARPVGLASFSHDGTRLAYCSASKVDAAVFVTDGDIFTVDYNNRKGGEAKPVPGASDPAYNEFYPVFSPDDRLIAYDRVPVGVTNYNSAPAEVFVVPTTGGEAVRLAGNDPPACTQKKSPGVTNSWPRWAPDKSTAGDKEYYFLVFSSTRNGASGGPQLYVSPVVASGGTIKTYAALYLWNQPENENNHTPAWDSFDLTKVPK